MTNEQKVLTPKIQEIAKGKLRKELNKEYVDMLNLMKVFEKKKENVDDLVMASYIKDFSFATSKEMKNVDNWLLLPDFIDSFFKKKLYSFKPEDGTAILSDVLVDNLLVGQVKCLQELSISKEYLTEGRKKFLAWHNSKLI